MQKAVTRKVQQRYTLKVTNLSKTDLKKLIEILKLDNPAIAQNIKYDGGKHAEEQNGKRHVEEGNEEMARKRNEVIIDEIKRLPADLRRNVMQKFLLNALVRAAVLCAPHKGLNPYIIGDIFDLIKREVTEYLTVFHWYRENLQEDYRSLVQALRSIQGLWWVPSGNSVPPIDRCNFQENRCEACMLARVIAHPMWLQNLRITLQSRTRTGEKHRAPTLFRFIDESINCHKYAYQILIKSNDMSIGLKATRKDAVKAFRRERQRTGNIPHLEDYSSHLCMPKGHQEEKYEKGEYMQSIVVYADQELVEEGENRPTYLVDDGTDVERQRSMIRRKHDTIADGIIALYENFDPSEYGDTTPLSISTEEAGLPIASPSSSEEAASLSSRAPCYTNTPRNTWSMYIPPPESVDWEDVINQRSPLDALSDGIEALLREEPQLCENSKDSEELADQYRSLLSPQVEYDCNSSDNDGSWEDAPVQEQRPEETTWSLVLNYD